MKTILEKIKNRKKTLFSFEILPPLRGRNINSIYKIINTLNDFNPAFCSITYHREEIVYKKLDNDFLQEKIVRKRPGTVAIAAAIQNKFPNLSVIPHIICGGFSDEETENALIDLHFLEINNLLALRGDSMKCENSFNPEKNGHKYSIELVKQIINLNKGKYLDNELENSEKTNFSVGVAAYPEKHSEAPNLDFDLKFLRKKIDAGASFIITQMFYDNKKFFYFVKKCRDIGIKVPIIPGLKPISTKKQISIIPHIFNIDIPEKLVNQVLKCKNNKEVRKIGINWAIEQSKELIDFGVPDLHFFTMGKFDNVYEVAKKIFK